MQADMACAEYGEAHGVYSADPGDYWELGAKTGREVAEASKCECGAQMIEVRHVDYWEPVEPVR